MAVTMVMEIPGADESVYNKVLEGIGDGHDAQLRPGQLAHIAAPMDGGWRVVDVWESEEAFGKFAQEHLGAALAGAGIPMDGPPPKFFPVRSYRVREAS